jgi:hypothetical protein
MQFRLYYALRQALQDTLALSAAQPPSDGSLLAPGFSRRVGLVLHSSSARLPGPLYQRAKQKKSGASGAEAVEKPR